MIEVWNLFIRLKKTFHHEKNFSPKRTPERQLLDFMLIFKMCQGLLGQLVFLDNMLTLIFFVLKS